jgi:hypothetical protein
MICKVKVHESHGWLPCTCNGISIDDGAEAMRDDDGGAVLQDERCTVILMERHARPYGWTHATMCADLSIAVTLIVPGQASGHCNGIRSITLTLARRSSAC